MNKILIPQMDNSYRMIQCEAAVIRAVLAYYGYGKIENYLGKSSVFFETDRSYVLPMYSRRMLNYYDELKEEHNFDIEISSYNDLEEATRVLKNFLKQGVPSIVRVDSTTLPFSPSYKLEGPKLHYLILTDISDQGDKVTIYDPSFKLYNEQISWEIFKNAACKKYSENDSLIHFIKVAKPQQTVSLDLNSFLDGLKRNVKWMLEPTREEFYNNSSIIVQRELQDLKIGIKGLYELADGYEKFIQGDDSKQSAFFMSYRWAIFAEQCELYGKYLYNMGEHFQLQEIKDISKEMDFIGQNWLLIKNMFLKSSIKDTNNLLKRAYHKIHETAELEELFFHNIDTIVHAYGV